MIKYLIEKEFKQIRRNSVIPRMVMGMTFMMIVILPWAADFEIKNIHISVVDKDHSTVSSRLIRKIESSGYFKLVPLTARNPVFVGRVLSALRVVPFSTADASLPPKLRRLQASPTPPRGASDSRAGARRENALRPELKRSACSRW